MKLPIQLKTGEFLALVTIETNPVFERPTVDFLLKPLPKSFYPIFVAFEKDKVKVYCLCTNQEDFVCNLARTGYKTELI